MRRLLLLLLFGCSYGYAQSGVFPDRPETYKWYVGTISLPSSATTVAVPANVYTGNTPTTVFVDQINLANTSASTVTVTVVDNSTNCNGGPCTVVPTVTMQANTLFTVALNGAPVSGGIKWNASVANVVHASMKGRY